MKMFNHGIRYLRLLFTGAMLCLSVQAQEFPDPAEMMAKNGTVSYVTWLDNVWINHLVARAEGSVSAPLLREAFLRDALRVDRARADTVLALARHYQLFSMHPLDRMMMAYGRRLAPQRNEWAALAGSGTTPPVARTWSEADEAAYKTAAEKFKAKNYISAEIDLRNLLIIHPAERKLVVDLGTLYIQTADWGMAAAALSHAVDLFPDHFDAANNLAVALDQVGRPDLVPAVLEAQLPRRPDDVYLIRNISSYAAAAGDRAKAIEFAARWMALEPDNEEAKATWRSLNDGGEATP